MSRFGLPRSWAIFAPLVLLFLVACGDGDIGDECDESGSMDECEDGLICTNQGEGAVCRALCEEQADCLKGEACNGISGSNLKSCQPDK